MNRRFVIFASLLALFPLPAAAQEDLRNSEIVVTGSRRDADGYVSGMPAITLRRKADFAIQDVTITGDTRDADKRHEEIYAMLRTAIKMADGFGVQLATGDTVVQPLTLDNYRDLTLQRDSRPDADKVSFLVKSPLSDATDSKTAVAKIDKFVKAVPATGRALMTDNGDLTLSVVKPDQYRSAILALVAEDSARLAKQFGPDYAVEVKGLEGLVDWARAGLTDVDLYIPYQLTVVPKR